MKIKISKKDIIDTSKYDKLSLKEINKLLTKRKEELKNSQKQISTFCFVLNNKNGNIPRVNQHSLNGTLPSDVSISDLVKNVNFSNYNFVIDQYQTKINVIFVKYINLMEFLKKQVKN